MIEHFKQTVPGVVGVGAVGTGRFVEFLTETEPVWHALAHIGTFLAGLATALYYFAQWRKSRKK